jgi:hypothetical protein
MYSHKSHSPIIQAFWQYISSRQACTAKENPAPVIAGLPGYVACSHLLLCYHTPDYEERAWCRVERMMAYALLTAGDVVFVVKEGFEHTKQPVLREDEWVSHHDNTRWRQFQFQFEVRFQMKRSSYWYLGLSTADVASPSDMYYESYGARPL